MLLSGDSLTVQLFIAAAAISLLGVGVTQAGWDHPYFVRALFVIGGALALAAIFWRPLSGILPGAGKLSVGPSGWLGLILVTTFVLGWREIGAREIWLKKLPEEIEKVTRQILPSVALLSQKPVFDGKVWKSGYEILEFADEKLRRNNAQLQASHAKNKQESAELDAEIKAFGPKTAEEALQRLVNPESAPENSIPELNALKLRKTRLDEEEYALRRSAEESHFQIVKNVYDKLKNVELIARGFVTPISPESESVFIPADKWTFLRIDFHNNKASGEGLSYTGVSVAIA